MHMMLLPLSSQLPLELRSLAQHQQSGSRQEKGGDRRGSQRRERQASCRTTAGAEEGGFFHAWSIKGRRRRRQRDDGCSRGGSGAISADIERAKGGRSSSSHLNDQFSSSRSLVSVVISHSDYRNEMHRQRQGVKEDKRLVTPIQFPGQTGTDFTSAFLLPSSTQPFLHDDPALDYGPLFSPSALSCCSPF